MPDPEAIAAARQALEAARKLAASDNELVGVTGRRLVAILVDLLLEIDPEKVSDPWSLLAPGEVGD